MTLLSVAFSAAACDAFDKPVAPAPPDPPPLTTHAVLTITVSTSGTDRDPDGFELLVNDTLSIRVAPNSTYRLADAPAGPYRIEVEDVARWCSVAGGGPEMGIVVGETGEHQVAVQVECRTTFRDWLLYTGGGEIRFFDLTGDRAQGFRLGYTAITCDGGCQWPAVSPNGEKVAWVSPAGLEIMNADGSGRKTLIRSTGVVYGAPSWSPDGAYLAHLDWEGTLPLDIYVTAVDGKTPSRRITFDGALYPAWSPDGRTIAYTAPGSDLWLIDPTGDNPRPVGASGSQPSWSPDSRSLLYNSGRMRIIDVTGENDRLVGPINFFSAVWSRDGTRIAFVGYDESSSQKWLATMTPLGTDVTRLTPSVEQSESPATPAWGF